MITMKAGKRTMIAKGVCPGCHRGVYQGGYSKDNKWWHQTCRVRKADKTALTGWQGSKGGKAKEGSSP